MGKSRKKKKKVTSNVDAVYSGHVGNHARFVSHGVVYFMFRPIPWKVILS